jgi:uncharacterized protein (DUF2237 family)
MRYAFIGDIQERPGIVETILAQSSFDHFVFVGDILDSFDYPPEVHIQALDQILNAVEDGYATLLYGNHELSYLREEFRCSGWNPTTARLFLAPGRLRRWERLAQAALWFPDAKLLCTHAGITRPLWEQYQLAPERLQDILDVTCADPTSWFYRAGVARGGSADWGGPLWCDWSTEFVPVPAIRQVVGHTRRTQTPNGFAPETQVQGLRYSPNGDVCVDCLTTIATVGQWDESLPDLFVEPYPIPIY